MFFIVIIVAVISVLFLFVFKFQVSSYWSKRRFPGPVPAILFGNTPNAILRRRNVACDYDDVYRTYKKFPFVGLFETIYPHLLVVSPVIVKKVLTKNFQNFSKNGSASKSHPIVSRNPSFVNGNKWNAVRSEIAPAFEENRVKASFTLVQNVCDEMTNYLKVQKHAIELKEFSAKFTIDVIASTVFAKDPDSFTRYGCPIRRMARNLIQPSIISTKSAVEKFYTSLMADAVKKRKTDKTKCADYLNYLLELQEKKGLTNLELAAHGCTFYNSGLENSSILLSFILFELSRNTDIQKRLRQEINETSQLTYETIENMKYLDQVVNETLRLHPPTVTIKKVCTENIEFNLNNNENVTIEKSASVLIPILSIHMDPQHYENPKTFDPDRFALKKCDYFKEKGVFLPFGDGPRSCIGKLFAVAHTKAAVVQIVKNFKVLQSGETRLPLQMTSSGFLNIPLGGLWAVFRPVTQ